VIVVDGSVWIDSSTVARLLTSNVCGRRSAWKGSSSAI